MGPGEPPEYLNVAEAARLMRVSNMTLYRLIRSAALPSLRVGNRYCLRPDDVQRYLRDSSRRPA